MAAYNTVIGIFAILLVCGHTGLAIRCFVCNSHTDSECSKETLPEEYKKDCADQIDGSKYVMCRKIVQNIDFEVNGNAPNVRVIRSCGWDDSNYFKRCYHRSGFGGRQEVCSCDADYCNGSLKLSASLTLTACTGLILALCRLLLF